MLNSPPDPTATLEAEQRAEDDGMPEPPAKAADPAGWADALVEREKQYALGYPTHPVAQAWTDLIHSAARLVDSVRPQRPVVTLSTVAGVAAGLAVYVLFLRNGRHRYYR
jgi:hypothetical protein